MERVRQGACAYERRELGIERKSNRDVEKGNREKNSCIK